MRICRRWVDDRLLAYLRRVLERVALGVLDRADDAPGLDVAQWLWLLKDAEEDLDALVDDAENRGIGERGAREMIVIRALIGWLRGGGPPGADAIGYLQRVVRAIPCDPDEDEVARRNVYLAAVAELGGDEEAASMPRWEPPAGAEERRGLLDLQGRAVRSSMEERGLTIGEVAERTGIDTVTLVSILFGLEEMRVLEWIRLSEAIGVPLDRLLDEGRDSADPADGEAGGAR